MKTLYLVRHAKAQARTSDLPDFDRSLVKSGKKDAKQMANVLKKEGIIPDMYITSPANRAYETAEIFAKQFGHTADLILKNDNIYNEINGTKFINIFKETNNKFNTILFFGHDPSISECAAFLLKDFQYNMPKAAVLGIQFNKRSWRQIIKGSGNLKLFVFPMDKTKKGKIAKKTQKFLHNDIVDSINQIMKNIDTAAATKMTKAVKKSSKKLAQEFAKYRKSYSLKSEDDIQFALGQTVATDKGLETPTPEEKNVTSKSPKTKSATTRKTQPKVQQQNKRVTKTETTRTASAERKRSATS